MFLVSVCMERVYTALQCVSVCKQRCNDMARKQLGAGWRNGGIEFNGHAVC